MLSLLKTVLKNCIQKSSKVPDSTQKLTSTHDVVFDKSQTDFAALWIAAEKEAAVGNQEMAKDYLYQALEIRPDNADILCQLGSLENKLGLYEDAIDNLLTAININPNLTEAYFSLGNLFANLKHFNEAIDFFERGINLSPKNSSLFCGLANVYLRQEKYMDAISFLKRAIEITPDDAMAYNNLGHCYIKLQKYNEAILPLKISKALNSSNTKVYINLNYVYYTLGNLKRAYYYVLHGLKIDPQDATLHWALAWSLLLFKRFESGWIEYESRFSESGQTERRLFNLPLWRGENLSGKTILIAAEQGLGDQIMLASCLDDILSNANTCFLECDAKLTSLFQYSFPKIQVIGTQNKKEQKVLDELTIPVDYYTHIGNLPSRFRNSYESFFPAKAYLSSKPESVAFWKKRLLELGNGLKVGISWRGGAIQTRSFLRTIPLAEWSPILKKTNVHFINLQYGESQQDLQDCFEMHRVKIHHWPDAIDDYLETAALIKSMDLVISVCTSVIHLAGALGQKTWVMVPVSPEWRYLARDEYLPWYQDVRLFRQTELGNWQPVLENVAHHLDLAQKNQEIIESAI